MAEKIKLFELEIDSERLTKSLVETRKQIEALRLSQKENTKATEEERKAFEQNAVVLKQLETEYRNNQKVLGALTQAMTQNVDTVDDARKSLSAVSTLWAQVTKVEGENSEQAKALAARKLELTNRLKELEGATGDTRRNVGNYTQGILEAAKASGGFTGQLGAFGGVLNQAAQGFQAAKGGTTGLIGGLRGVGGAITATGIGALVQIVVLLIQSLSQVKAVTDPLEVAFKAVGAVIGEIVVRAEALFEAFGFLINGQFSKAADSASASVSNLGGSLKNAANEAAGLARAQQDLDDAARRNKVINAEIQTQIDVLIAQSRNRTLTEEERIAKLQEANRLESEAFQRSKKQAEEQLRIDQRNLQLKTKLTDAELQLFFSGNATSKQLDDIQKKLDKGEDLFIKYSDSRVALEEIKRQSLTLTAKLEGRIDQLRQQGQQEREQAEQKAEAARQKRQAARTKAEEENQKAQAEANDLIIEAFEEEIRLFEAKNKTLIDSDTELTNELVAGEVARVAELLRLREQLYKEQLRQGKISEGRFKLLIQGLNEEFDKLTTGLTAKSATQQLDRLSTAIKEAQLNLELGRNREGVLLTPEQVAKEKKLIDDLERAEIAQVEAQFANTVGKEAEKKLALLQIEKQYNKERNALDNQLLSEEEQRAASDFNTKLELLKLRNESEFEIRRQQLAQQQEVEVAAAEAIGADVSAVNEKYRLLNEQLDRDAVNSRLSIASEYLTQFSQLVGENTAFGKLAASAAAAINTFMSAQEAFRSQLIPNDPTSFPRAIIAAAFATATGLKTIANINKTKVPTAPPKRDIPKLEDGGAIDIGGKYHSSGGTKFFGEDGTAFEAERDEMLFVLNRNASAKIRSLEKLNSLFPMAKKVGTFQAGGFPQFGIADSANAIQQADIFSAVTEFRPVVDVKDIITETNRRVQVTDSATI